MFGFGGPGRKKNKPAAKKASLAKRLRGRLRRQKRHQEHDPVSAAGFAGELLDLHNAARHRTGLGSLRLNGDLGSAASGKASEMDRFNYMSHTNRDGSFFDKRITRTGYDWVWCGENIAEGFSSASAVFSAWMNSPPHRANILSRKATEIGFGNSGGAWSAEFGNR